MMLASGAVALAGVIALALGQQGSVELDSAGALRLTANPGQSVFLNGVDVPAAMSAMQSTIVEQV